MLTFSEKMLSGSYRGLSALDVEVREREFGKNVRPTINRKTSLETLWGIVSEPMLLLLIATTVIYFFIGSHLETAIFAFSIIPIVLIEYFQERRTDKAIRLLDSLLVEECQVYRDGVLKRLPSTDLVPGDLVYLAAGDKVPGDGVVVRSPGLMVDESVLTGESMPVVKSQYQNDLTPEDQLYQGTMVVQGQGEMVILATGGETHYGKLGNLLESIAEESTPLQKKVQGLVSRLAVGAVITSLFIGVVIWQRHGLMQGLLGSLTIAMSIIPEEFPIVFSVFLIMGVWRLSKRNALVRKMVMVETLGSVTTICTDKTGTLTEGKMSLEKVYFDGKLIDLAGMQDAGPIAPLVTAAVLAMEQVAIDPMEIEMQRFAKVRQIINEEFYQKYILKKDSSFSAATKLVNHIWVGPDKSCFQYTAGAPESVVQSCHWADEKEKTKATEMYEKLAEQGYRVVAIAKTECTDPQNFIKQHLNFCGLIVLSDPPRYGVKEALQVCRRAGVRVIMITGDHALTAKAIAERVGLDHRGAVVEGKEIDEMPMEKLRDLVQERTIFARIRPEQKFLIVEALQANDEIVAMTGDGVNDAPALKKATVGIAMGQKGTAVARAASGVVLLDDNFTTIVKAVEEGRRIYDNIRQAFVFLFSFHAPVICLAVIPLLLGQDLYFLPIHIIFLELFGDPTTVIGLERDPLAKGAMDKPPRPSSEPLINPKLWWQISWQAAGISGLALWFYGYGLFIGNLSLGRTMSFMALVVSQLVLVLINRDITRLKKNHVLLLLVICTAGVLHLIILIPLLRTLFHFVPLDLTHYSVVVVAAVASMAFFNVIAQSRWRYSKD
jgi:Ca2+-transporting ATPase